MLELDVCNKIKHIPRNGTNTLFIHALKFIHNVIYLFMELLVASSNAVSSQAIQDINRTPGKGHDFSVTNACKDWFMSDCSGSLLFRAMWVLGLYYVAQ